MSIPKDAPFLALGWWKDLQPARDPDPARDQPGDRAALARLRRCGTVSEAMQEKATLDLFRTMKATHAGDLVTVALTAAVLAHVRTDGPGILARLIGPVSFDKPATARLKPLRFRRLMEAETPDERLLAFRRLVDIAGPKMPVQDLAGALLDWSDHRRTRWTMDYWDAWPSAPLASPAQPAAPGRSAVIKDAFP